MVVGSPAHAAQQRHASGSAQVTVQFDSMHINSNVNAKIRRKPIDALPEQQDPIDISEQQAQHVRAKNRNDLLAERRGLTR